MMAQMQLLIQKNTTIAGATGNATSVATYTCLSVQNSVPAPKTQIVGNICLVEYSEESTFDLEIPIEEKAVEADNAADRMDMAWERIFQPSLSGTANLKGVLNDCLYAGVQEDSKGDRTVVYHQRYNNGKVSNRISIPNADILLSQKCIRENRSSKLPRKISNIIDKAQYSYLNKFKGQPDEILDINQILDALCKTLFALPVQGTNINYERKEFYRQVIEIAQRLQTQVFDKHKCYYPLLEYDIADIASSMNMKQMELLRKLRDYGFLYLTPSSKGYQTNVRIKYPDGNSYTEWRYCLIKLSYFAGIDDDSDAEYLFDF